MGIICGVKGLEANRENDIRVPRAVRVRGMWENWHIRVGAAGDALAKSPARNIQTLEFRLRARRCRWRVFDGGRGAAPYVCLLSSGGRLSQVRHAPCLLPRELAK